MKKSLLALSLALLSVSAFAQTATVAGTSTKADRQAAHEARVEQRKENIATKIDAVNTRHATIEQHLSNNEARAAKLNARQDKLLNK